MRPLAFWACIACGRERGDVRSGWMADDVNSSSRQPGWRGWVRNPQDFYGGLALVILALLAFWASWNLPGMRGFAFGPGTAPRLFAALLLVTGTAVALMGFF